ncbi:hypothetical protein EVAR_8276_1 [Eumeta japonica]|uniref:Uncharacterized protein n=1 Tax=Eumeta variegata TaxID=151549 RepID=A0A4C1Y860_EUMVA|nr:hypothetical protein EVAR_8276_1 [Eumeta japonica]
MGVNSIGLQPIQKKYISRRSSSKIKLGTLFRKAQPKHGAELEFATYPGHSALRAGPRRRVFQIHGDKSSTALAMEAG